MEKTIFKINSMISGLRDILKNETLTNPQRLAIKAEIKELRDDLSILDDARLLIKEVSNVNSDNYIKNHKIYIKF